MSSLAGRWFKPGLLLSPGKGDEENASLANGWGEGLRPLPSWTGDRQSRSALMWLSSSPNRVLRQGWWTGLPSPCNRGTLLWECLISSPCSVSSDSIIKGSLWSLELWPCGDNRPKIWCFLWFVEMKVNCKIFQRYIHHISVKIRLKHTVKEPPKEINYESNLVSGVKYGEITHFVVFVFNVNAK